MKDAFWETLARLSGCSMHCCQPARLQGLDGAGRRKPLGD